MKDYRKLPQVRSAGGFSTRMQRGQAAYFPATCKLLALEAIMAARNASEASWISR